MFWTKLQHNISIFGSVMVETWPPVYMNYCKQYIPSQVAESPCSRLTASCKSQSCAYLLVPPPHLFGPKLQHYIPISGLVLLPKWRPRYMGFMQLDQPHCRLQSNVTWVNPVCRSQSYFLFIGVIHLASGPNWSIKAQCCLSYGGNMTPAYINILQPV